MKVVMLDFRKSCKSHMKSQAFKNINKIIRTTVSCKRTHTHIYIFAIKFTSYHVIFIRTLELQMNWIKVTAIDSVKMMLFIHTYMDGLLVPTRIQLLAHLLNRSFIWRQSTVSWVFSTNFQRRSYTRAHGSFTLHVLFCFVFDYFFFLLFLRS